MIKQEDRSSLLEAFLANDRYEARRIIQGFMSLDKHELDVEELISSTLVEIGDGWGQGEYSLAQVYMTSSLCEEIMKEEFARMKTSSFHDVSIGIGVFLDFHALGKSIVSSVLLASGYKAKDYGEGLSESHIKKIILEDEPDFMLLSVLMYPSALRIKSLLEWLKDKNLKTKLVVGGAPFRLNERLAQEIGAKYWCKYASDIIQILREGEGFESKDKL